MRNKLVSLGLAICLVLSIVVPSFAAEEGFEIQDGVLFRYTGDATKIVIPDNVTEIAEEAFFGSRTIETVTIPGSVSVIREAAFYNCSALKSVSITDGVTELGSYCFSECRSLTDIALPSTLKTIGDFCFYDCTKLDNILLPSGLTSIGTGALAFCQSLSAITIPNSVTYIGELPFVCDFSLTKISVGPSNRFYTAFGGALFDKGMTTLIAYAAGKWDSSYTIPQTVTKISAGAFYASFYLDRMTIPSGVTEIAPNAFHFCEFLVNFSVDSDNQNYSASQGVLYNNNFTELVRFPEGKSAETYTVIDTVERIREEAFFYCDKIKEIILPESVKAIGESAFKNCKSLEKLILPESITEIGESILENCENINNVLYLGSELGWSKIAIGKGNEQLIEKVQFAKTAEEDSSDPVVVLTSQALLVNGTMQKTEIYNIDGSNYFKLRDIAALLNGTGSQFSVEYDGSAGLIVVQCGEEYINTGTELVTGVDHSSTAVKSPQRLIVDGSVLSFTAYNIGGFNFFKLRDLGSALGFYVDYNSVNRAMIIKSK